jgi:hypothetical protein
MATKTTTADALREAHARVIDRIDCYNESVEAAAEAVYPDYGGLAFRTALISYTTGTNLEDSMNSMIDTTQSQTFTSPTTAGIFARQLRADGAVRVRVAAGKRGTMVVYWRPTAVSKNAAIGLAKKARTEKAPSKAAVAARPMWAAAPAAVALTSKEQRVLDALVRNGRGNGGDFACAEDIDTKALQLTKQQFGALLTTLQTKGRIDVHVVYVNGSLTRGDKGDKVTQVTFRDVPPAAAAPQTFDAALAHGKKMSRQIARDTKRAAKQAAAVDATGMPMVDGKFTRTAKAPVAGTNCTKCGHDNGARIAKRGGGVDCRNAAACSRRLKGGK